MTPSGPSGSGDRGDKAIHAAEIALGLSTPEFVDADLDAEVARWEEWLGDFAQELPPEPPPPAVWHAIRSATQPAAPAWWRSTLDSLALWRGLSVLGFAVVALLVLLPRSAPVTLSSPGRTLLVSSLRQKEGTPLYVVTYDPARMLVIAVPAGP